MRFLILVFLVFISCEKSQKNPDPTPIILITVDTLRSDHLPQYGYKAIQTPGFDSLAEVSHIYEAAFSTAPMTLPAHASIMTGLDLPNHGVLDNAGYKLKDSFKSLAESLKEERYTTVAFISSAVLRDKTGISQGFDIYDDQMGEDTGGLTHYGYRSGQETLNRAKQWLSKQSDDHFFLWIHLFEPHTPYAPPRWTLEHTQDPYDGEILEVDRLLSDFWKILKKKGIFDSAMIVLTSDHGEGLGDHGEAEHGLLTYREAIQVPLFIKLPFQNRSMRFSQPVSVIDINPTILKIKGKKVEDLDGISILPKPKAGRLIRAQAYAPSLHFGWHIHQSVVQDNWHLVMAGEPEAFQWLEDPRETHSYRLPSSKTKMFRGLVPESLPPPEGLSKEDKELLASLGYSGQFSPDEGVKNLSKAEFLQLHGQINQSIHWFAQKEYPKVIKSLTPLVEQFSKFADARLFLAKSLRLTGKLEQARFVIDKGLQLQPSHAPFLLELTLLNLNSNPKDLLASALLHAGRDPQASFEQVVPLLFLSNRTWVLTEMAQKVSDPFLANWIFAQLAYRAGDFQLAKQSFLKAYTGEAGNQNISLFYYLGDVLVRTGELESGLSVWDKGLALEPNHLAMRRNYCFALASGDRLNEVGPFLRNWIRTSDNLDHQKVAESICQKLGLNFSEEP